MSSAALSTPQPFAGLAAGECVLAADIGGTKTTTAWVDAAGRVHGTRTDPSRALLGPGSVLGVTTSGLRHAFDDAVASGHRPVAIGVGTAGVVDGGIITSATDAIIDWVGTDVAGALRSEFALPTGVLNDVHAHGLGEAVRGAGQGRDSMLLVAVGTGIGGAIITGGEVRTGARAAAGHVGHVSVPEAAGVHCPCGKTGHLEGLASGTGIHRAYNRHGERVDSTRDVFARAYDGESLATNVITDCAFATGRAIGDLLNVLDPDLVVISGGIAETGEIWWGPLRRGVEASAMNLLVDTPVVPARLGADAALIGAAHYARSHHGS